MIPTIKVVLKGDKWASQSYIKFAQAQLAILEKQMSFQELNEGRRVVSPIEGVVVECLSRFNHKEIRIDVVSFTSIVPDESIGDTTRKCIKEKKKTCLCFPHFSMGRIISTYPAQLVDDSPVGERNTYNDFLFTGRFTYDVLVCNSDDYILFLGINDPNFGRYYEGQLVLVSIDKEMPLWDHPLDCDRGCLIDDPQFQYLCVSILVLSNMEEYQEEEEEKCI